MDNMMETKEIKDIKWPIRDLSGQQEIHRKKTRKQSRFQSEKTSTWLLKDL